MKLFGIQPGKEVGIIKNQLREAILEGEIKNDTNEEVESYYKRNSVMYLVNNIAPEKKKSVRWYIDCGDDDFFCEGNSLVHIAMRKNDIPHEFRIGDGGHSWTYWRAALPNVLEFVSQSFHQY